MLSPDRQGSKRAVRPMVIFAAAVIVAASGMVATNGTAGAAVTSRTYTTTADFDEGTGNNVSTSGDELKLEDTAGAFPFIWIALSARGTIAKIDTVTGAIVGEYSTTSDGDNSSNPSRTTVANDGSVWAGNRNQSSVVHVALAEAGRCVDRNGNGTIETSTGFGDVLPWPGGSSGASAPVSDAADECIIHYVDTAGNDARHVSVDGSGNIWVGSFGSSIFQQINGVTGTIVAGTQRTFSCGGYGGLIDGNGVLWSATSGVSFLRWDPNAPDVANVNPRCIPLDGNYGMARDSQNNVWISTFNSSGVHKVSPDGNTIQQFTTGIPFTQGLAIDSNDHVWLSSSLSGGANNIGHLKNDGTLVGYVTGAGAGSTGVSVDAAGKIWVANIDSSDATRIDPNSGPIGLDGVTRVGAFDLTVPLPGASPYNYSDMTGSTLTGKAAFGTWSLVHDSGVADAPCGQLSWVEDTPGDSSLVVTLASSADGVTFGEPVIVTNGAALEAPVSQYLQIGVTLNRATTAGEPSPVIRELKVSVGCEDPTPDTTVQDPATADVRRTAAGAITTEPRFTG
jgi:streptogramin lyase